MIRLNEEGLGCKVSTQDIERYAYVPTGDEVLYAWRSFEAYPGIVTVAGATSVTVPNRADGTHELRVFPTREAAKDCVWAERIEPAYDSATGARHDPRRRCGGQRPAVPRGGESASAARSRPAHPARQPDRG